MSDMHHRPYATLLERLKTVGLRPTRQRLGLARLLFSAGDRHVTAEQLHGAALEAQIRVSLATIYNTLNLFSRHGIVREMAVDSARLVYDSTTSVHHHFYNVDTGELMDIDAGQVELRRLPELPAGTEAASVELLIRLRRKA